MSKKRKTGFPDDLWGVFLIDEFDWDSDIFTVAGPIDRESAHAEYEKLTAGGTRETERDKHAFTYYVLRRIS